MDDLPDPKSDRMVKSVPPPPQRPLTADRLFTTNNKVEWKILRDHLKK